ncbi:putative alcohol dehydrogenase [Echria macrotheca]|uniref:Alcohol dehydrogenase n=1 Tax=Echria macrotheca TaxID=438768 RepID=A0AAJ0B1C7_9PEZI|nr:putative alcohol dehydrogenase [Echria macrotheca]
MTTQRAVKVLSEGKATVADNAPLPALREGDVLVKIACVAINPADGKSLVMSPTPGAVIGSDFAGTIFALAEENGAGTIKLKVGDRVCGFVFGNNPFRVDNGAFSEYVAVPAGLVIRIPDSMSFEEAATLGTGLATSGLALYHMLKLPMPSQPATKPSYALVYGGGTSTGTIAIQLLRRSGFIPVTTCSPRSEARLKSIGAAHTFDYKAPTCGSDIREYTQNQLAVALDCITDTRSMTICYEAIGTAGGDYLALNPFPLRAHTRRSVKPDWIITYSVFDQPIGWQRPFNWDPRPLDKEFAVKWYEQASQLLDRNLIRSHPYQIRPGGLNAVPEGVESVWKGEIMGHKLVYQVQDSV